MTADFLDAHDRHWQDAELLFASSRFANADHLYGVSAECGLKRLMIAFNMQLDSLSGSPADFQDKVHIMEAKKTNLWDRYETYRSGHKAGTDYGLSSKNPFNDWDVSQRYAHRSVFSEARVQHHREGADLVKTLVQKAVLEGLV
jgi:hypothetical protein